VNGYLEGPGEMQYYVGHRYVGNWSNNKKNGVGIFYYMDGNIYQGEWKGGDGEFAAADKYTLRANYSQATKILLHTSLVILFITCLY